MKLNTTPPVLPPTKLQQCPDCHEWISQDARTCPHCGRSFTTASGVFVAIIVAVVLAALFGLLR